MSDVYVLDCHQGHNASSHLRTCFRPASVADLVAALLNEGGEKVWLCREKDRIHDWAEGSPPHCWFMAESGHHPECGWHLVVPLEDE